MKKVFFAIVIIVIIIFSIQLNDNKGVIKYIHSKTNVRQSPSTSAKIVATLPPNTKVQVITTNSDWWLVFDKEVDDYSKINAIGYVHKSLLHTNHAPAQTIVKKQIQKPVIIPQLSYSIVNKRDVSYLNTPRMVYNILLETDTIPDETAMKDLSIKIWKDGNKKWKEFTVMIYLTGMNTNGLAYGIGEFRPNKMEFFRVEPAALTIRDMERNN